MSLLNKNFGHRCLPGRAILLLAVLLMLSACATQQKETFTPPPLQHDGPETQVAEIDVLALSAEMEEFLERYILEYSDLNTRLYLLMNAITSNGVIGFDYNAALTLTASEAFENQTGNCIAFANMMVALARRAGLKASYQEVFRRPEWSSREDTVLLIKHINVIIEGRGYTYVVDPSGIKINPNVRRRIIDDNYAKAMYLNNIGAEALLEDELPRAYAYMRKAIDTEPLMTDPWVNMGVVFGRNDQLVEAETVFLRALNIDASEFSAMSNLYEVYIAQENLVAASALQAKVEKYRWSNPYYLLKLSDEAIEQENFKESISLLRRAIRRKKNDHLLHFALAKTQYLSGETAAAEGSLVRAREFAPEHMIPYYDRPLVELVAED